MALPLLVQTLIGQGLNVLAGAVAAKGTEVIEEKLGINIQDALGTENGRLRLRQLELEYEQFLITSAMERDKLDYTNTADARSMNVALQQAESGSWLSKNFSYLLDTLIVGGTLILAYMIFDKAIPEGNKEVAYAAFGSLLTLCGTVVNFHRGSSAGSARKNGIFESVMMKQGEQK